MEGKLYLILLNNLNIMIIIQEQIQNMILLKFSKNLILMSQIQILMNYLKNMVLMKTI